MIDPKLLPEIYSEVEKRQKKNVEINPRTGKPYKASKADREKMRQAKIRLFKDPKKRQEYSERSKKAWDRLTPEERKQKTAHMHTPEAKRREAEARAAAQRTVKARKLRSKISRAYWDSRTPEEMEQWGKDRKKARDEYWANASQATRDEYSARMNTPEAHRKAQAARIRNGNAQSAPKVIAKQQATRRRNRALGITTGQKKTYVRVKERDEETQAKYAARATRNKNVLKATKNQVSGNLTPLTGEKDRGARNVPQDFQEFFGEWF